MDTDTSKIKALLDRLYGLSIDSTLAIVRASNIVAAILDADACNDDTAMKLHCVEDEIEKAMQPLTWLRIAIEDSEDSNDS